MLLDGFRGGKYWVRYLGLFFLVQLLVACGNNGASITTQINEANGIPIPEAITTALPSTGTLSAYITIDQGERQPMDITGDSASITLSDVSLGAHIITIEFEFVFTNDPSKPSTPLTLASASKALNITGGENSLDFASTDYTVSYDEDKDGITNLDELANNTNPFAGVIVSAISNSTSEDGAQAYFSVVLTSKPTADVTINISSSDPSEGIVDKDVLTFTSSNWDTEQRVYVTGLDDNIIDGNVTYTIVTSSISSGDPSFDKLDPADVSVVNIDNDAPSFNESAILNHTSESGASVAFSVVLSSQPSSDVTVPVSSSNTNEGTVSPATLTFTPTNWNTATDHIVTVTGVDDSVIDGPQNYQVILAPATSLDTNFDGQDPPDPTVTNDDNDIPGVSIGTLSNGGHTTESGGTVTFNLQLNTQPSSTVTINLASSNTNEGTVSPASLDFTTADWNVPSAHTVTVTGVDDNPPVADGPQTYTITLSKPVSSDTNYSQLNASDVTVINDDNEPTPSISLSFDQTAIAEDSGTAPPTASSATLTATSNVVSTKDIVVTLGFSGGTATSGTDYTVGANSITISAGSTIGTTTLTTTPDSLYEGDETVKATITSVTNGLDAGAPPASLTITDNDPVPLVSLSIDNTSINEASPGNQATLTASLENASGSPITSGLPVTVNLTYSGLATSGSDYTAAVNSITIPAGSTSSSSDNAGIIATVISKDDTLVEGDETVIVDLGTITNGGPGATTSATTTIIDDDVPVANFTGASQSVTEGLSAGVNVSSTPVTLSVTLDQPGIVNASVPFTVSGTATGGVAGGVGVDHDLLNGTLTIPAGNTAGTISFNVFNDSNVEPDETVIITLGTSTSAKPGTSNSYTVTIVNNAAPTVNNVAVTDTTGNVPTVTGDVLGGTYNYADAEGDPESASGSAYQWMRDGYAIKGATGASYTLTLDDAGAQITLQVTPTAATGTLVGTPVMSAAIAVDHAPRATNVGIKGTLPLAVGGVLTGTYTYSNFEPTDLENTAATSFRWFRNGTPIPGQTASTYTLTASDIGQSVQFEVSPVALSGSLVGKSVLSPNGVNVSRVGELVGGRPTNITIQGDYAYVAADGVMSIVDISNPNHLTQVSYYDAPGTVKNIAVSGTYAYIADGSSTGMQIVDISDPKKPFLVGATSIGATAVAVSGTYAYVAESGSNSLQIYDVSVPTAPAALGLVAMPTTGYPDDMVLSGTYAYVADEAAGLRIIDVSDVNNPFEATSFSETNASASTIRYYSVAVYGGKAYVAAYWDGFRVLDVSSPSTTAPSLISSLAMSHPYHVAISSDGTSAYVADMSTMSVVSISDPANPSIAGVFDPPASSTSGVALSGNYAYLADSVNGVVSVDIADPGKMKQLSSFDTPSQASGVAVNGNYAYVGDIDSGLDTLDITDPSAPIQIGNLAKTFTSTYGSLAMSGNFIYAGAYGLHVVDATVQDKPVQVKSIYSNDQTSGVAVSGNYAYIADGSTGLRIFDISTPSAASEVATVPNPVITGSTTSAQDVAISADGNYAFVADWGGGVRAIYIADPLNPVEVASVVGGITAAQGITILGNYAYVANNYGGVHIVDVSAPGTPAVPGTITDVGSVSYTDAVMRVAAANNQLYVALYSTGGLDILDLSVDPTVPTEVGYVRTPGYGSGQNVNVFGTNIYFSDSAAGVEIYQYNP